MIMERKIGEIFEYNGEWYQCIEGTGCYKCDFNIDESTCIADNPHCTCRSDKKDVVFKKLEKVGEPYLKRVSDGTFSTFQRYRVYNSVILPKEPYIYCNFIDGTIEIEIKQTKEDMEEKKLNLKPFDIQKAREGKPVCTRDGRKARIICFDLKDDNYPLAAAVEGSGKEEILCYTSTGHFYELNQEVDLDLMMLPEKKEGWANIYYEHDAPSHREASWVYDKEEEAIKAGKEHGSCYIATVRIEWEE